MTDTPHPIDPEHVDELLSADLDGELADAVADLGYDGDDVRAQIAANPELQARRDALDRARHALATVSPLDEVTAARLRTAARAELRPPKRTRLYAISGAIAAALVLVVAVVAVAANHSSSSVKTESSASAARPFIPTTRAPASTGTNFGVVAGLDGLVTRVEQVPRAVASAPLHTGDSTSDQHVEATAKPAEASGGVSQAPLSCSLTAQNIAGRSAQLVEQGTATLSGNPVSVWVYDRTGAPELLVVLSPDCKLVAARPLGTTTP
jgi:hypothetical protein